MALDDEFDKPRPPPGAELVDNDFDLMAWALQLNDKTWAERIAEQRERY